MSSARLEAPDAVRHQHELALRAQGFVPLTAHDAPSTQFDTLLPPCRIEQVVPDRRHGRIVWSHPGRSGLDPRAVAPLALVRVADGIGRNRLDPQMTLDAAARWLLEGDVTTWLQRSRHRILVRYDGMTCVYESDGGSGRCQTHPMPDRLLQQVADALGDRSLDSCRPHRWTEPHCVVWGQDAERQHDLGGTARCALAATHRLGRTYRDGLTGTAAWDAARGRSRGSAALELPAVSDISQARGMPGFSRWKMSIHRRDVVLDVCSLCGARDDREPCRTCRQENRQASLPTEWRAYDGFAQLHRSYRPASPRSAVACADRNCRTSLALSTAGAEGMQQ